MYNNMIPAYDIFPHVQQEGRYTWADGSTVMFTYWNSDEPAAGKRCALMSHSLEARWQAKECNSERGIICKITLSEHSLVSFVICLDP